MKNIEIIKKYLTKKWKQNLLIFFIFLFVIFLNHYVLAMNTTKKNTKKDSIVLATNNFTPPLSFDGEGTRNGIETDNGEKISGSDVFLMKDIADKLNKDLRIKIYNVEGCINNLELGQVDAIIGMLDITEERQNNFLAIPYSNVDLSILIRNDDNIDHDIIESKKNKKDGSISLEFLKKKNGDKIILSTITGCSHDIRKYKFDRFTDIDKKDGKINLVCREQSIYCAKAVEQKEADAFILEYPVLKNLAESEQNRGKFKVFKLNDKDLKLKPLGIFLKNDDKGRKLKAKIEKELKELINVPNKEGEMLNINTSLQDYWATEYSKKAQEDYECIQVKEKEQMQKNFIQRIWQEIPKYKQGFIISLTVAVNSLFLGFILSLFFFRVKISVENNKKTQKNILMYLQKIFSFLIDILMNMFESVPVIVLALLFHSVLAKNFEFFKTSLNAFYVAIIVISLGTTIDFTHKMMHNNKFLDKGQIEAAYALGMNQKQVFKEIIFSQILKRTIPSIKNQFIINIKETAAFSIIGLIDLLWVAKRNVSKTYDVIIPFVVVTLIYIFLVSLIQTASKFKITKKKKS